MSSKLRLNVSQFDLEGNPGSTRSPSIRWVGGEAPDEAVLWVGGSINPITDSEGVVLVEGEKDGDTFTFHMTFPSEVGAAHLRLVADGEVISLGRQVTTNDAVVGLWPNEIAIRTEDQVIEIRQSGARGPSGVGVPEGGSPGQVLGKTGLDDFETAWVDGSVPEDVLTSDDIGGAVQAHSGVLDNTTAAFTTEQASKLFGISPGAQPNVQSDWNAGSGDAHILHKPTLGTAAAADTGDFATSAQGDTADSAIQPGDLANVATSGDYGDLDNTPTIPTDASEITYDPSNTGMLATNVQDSIDEFVDTMAQVVVDFGNAIGPIQDTANSALQPDDLSGTGLATYDDGTGVIDVPASAVESIADAKVNALPEVEPGIGTELNTATPGEVRVNVANVLTFTFDTVGTHPFVMPAGARMVELTMYAGGGGGAGGQAGAEGTKRYGGGGGGAGGVLHQTFDASVFDPSFDVVVGAGGAGGNSSPSPGYGGPGGNGGNTSFGPIVVTGGQGANHGGGFVPGAGGVGGRGNLPAGSGNNCLMADDVAPLGAVASTGLQRTQYGATGGGGAGNYRSATDVSGLPSSGGSGSGANGGGNGQPGGTASHDLGGGGGGGNTAAGSSGGPGGFPGGGGGGGAFGQAANSGAGGAGADGLVVARITLGVVPS